MADEEETLLPYDIVELVTSDDMNGNFAYITRIPIESDALVNSEIPYAFESVSAVINKIKKCLIVLMLSLWC